MASPGDRPAQPGWYPDPGGSPAHRYWDGMRWTDALSSAIPPASPTNARDDTRTWAVAAHLSAPVSVVVAMVFVGPLVVYLVKRDDPFVRRHAAEALNFSLSFLLYEIVLGVATVVGLLFVVGILLIGVMVAVAVAWFVFVCVAAVKAGNGEDYRYPLTIRFVNS